MSLEDKSKAELIEKINQLLSTIRGNHKSLMELGRLRKQVKELEVLYRTALRHTPMAQKMCGSKRLFTSEAEAHGMVVKFQGRVYKCPLCYCWHHTTKEPREIV